MATAPQAFRRKLQDRLTPARRESILVPIETYEDDEDGNEVLVNRDEYNFSRPTQEQILLAFSLGGREDSTMGDEIAAIFSFMKDTLEDRDYKRLMKRFRDPSDTAVDSELLIQIFQFLMEQWQSFPTQQPADSSGSQASAGGRSTGRARGKGSTRSNSTSTGS